jgi:hypothetical protein
MKNRGLILALALGLILMGAPMVVSHPHITKSITAKLPAGAEVTITYNTTPANESHAKSAAVGSFLTPRRPKLKVSAEIKAGGATIPAGEYTLGVVKNGDNDFTMALYAGDPPRGGAAPDATKMIKLDSRFDTAHGKAEHMLIDLQPGAGKMEGKLVLTLHFGTLFLEGAVS